MRNTNPKHAYLLKVHPETRIKPQVLISDVKDLNPKELQLFRGVDASWWSSHAAGHSWRDSGRSNGFEVSSMTQ